VVLAGYVLLIGGIAVTTPTQAVNAFFEPGVRIQKERGQRVITSGPYIENTFFFKDQARQRLIYNFTERLKCVKCKCRYN
jgi:hypothetical protein